MNLIENAKEITLDELPLHSRWMSYLVGLNSLDKTLDKNAESLKREFGDEKWGALLVHLRSLASPTLSAADKFFVRKDKLPFYSEGKLYVAEPEIFLRHYVELIYRELRNLQPEVKHLVELGAGYGSILFKLATMPGFENVGLTAGEYTDWR